MYRLSWPLATTLAKYFGVELYIKIDVELDAEQQVYVATSADIPGLVIEAETFDQLQHEVKLSLPELIDVSQLPKQTRTQFTTFDFCSPT
ncbi:MAG: DUF1902 domain-containing protein [Hydrogenovibrio sp.]